MDSNIQETKLNPWTQHHQNSTYSSTSNPSLTMTPSSTVYTFTCSLITIIRAKQTDHSSLAPVLYLTINTTIARQHKESQATTAPPAQRGTTASFQRQASHDSPKCPINQQHRCITHLRHATIRRHFTWHSDTRIYTHIQDTQVRRTGIILVKHSM